LEQSPGMVGCLAAIEAIKVVTGWGEPLEDRFLAFDLEQMSFQKLPVTRDPTCPVCAEGYPPTPAETWAGARPRSDQLER
jgi:bacteriocin biosynthesis cyclodehydratase domain-containing protein